MSLKIKQISSLEKILPKDMVRGNEVFEKTMLRGQSFNYQIVLTETAAVLYDVSVESPIADQVHLYTVQNAQTHIGHSDFISIREAKSNSDVNFIQGLYDLIKLPACISCRFLYQRENALDDIFHCYLPRFYDICIIISNLSAVCKVFF